LLQAGVLANAATDDVIRLAPALNVSDPQISEFLEIFSKVVTHG
jgi:acetylornithine/succinyldiaminopimelate/putrescine aminotransferase